MPEANVEIVRSVMESFNRRDVEGFAAHLAPDAEIVPLRAAVDGTVYRGPDAAAVFFAAVDETWDGLSVDVEELLGGDGWVLGLGRIRGRGRGSGAGVDVEAALVVRFRGALITRFHTYTDRAEARQAVGLSE
jgi:ketosteroid isomerase-like protein